MTKAMPFTAQDVRKIQSFAGLGIMECRSALEWAEGDLYLAAAYLKCSGVAIRVKEDRDAYVRNQAELYAEELRQAGVFECPGSNDSPGYQ